MRSISKSLVMALALACFAFAVVAAPARADDPEYRWLFKADLDPFCEPPNDPQTYFTGAGYWPESPVSVFEALKGDGGGSSVMYQYIPKIKTGDRIEGEFEFNVVYYDAGVRQKTTYVHDVKESNGAGVRFVVRHLDSDTFKVGVEGWSSGGKQWGPYYLLDEYNQAVECDVDTWYKLSYSPLVCFAYTPSGWNTVNVTLSDASGQVGSRHLAKKTQYTTYWTRLSYGIQAGHTQELEIHCRDAVAKVFNGPSSSGYTQPIDPGIQSGCRWILSSSLDPLDSGDPYTVEGSVSELTSGLRSGAWDNGMSASTTAESTAAIFEQLIPGIAQDPAGLEGDSLDGAVTIAGKFWVKLSSTAAESGDYTAVHWLTGTDDTGVRFRIKHSQNGYGELYIELLKESGENIVIDDYDSSSSDDWDDDWHYVYYKLTREWIEDPEPEEHQEWDDYTMEVWIDAESGAPDCSISGSIPITNANLRRAHYGAEVDEGRNETWYLDDAWISAGIRDWSQ